MASERKGRTVMSEVSLVRLYVLRATYLFAAVGLGFLVWPSVLNHPDSWTLMRGVAACLLATVGVLALLGLRYPLQMLPILFFELTWKVIWLLAFALPMSIAGRVDAAMGQSIRECLLGIVLLPAVIPWRYVFAHYVRKPGDRWR